jgi:signal transduction histidine kinase
VSSQPEILAEADADLARRSLPGICGNISVVLFLLVAGDYVQTNRALSEIMAGVILLACAVRLILILQKDKIYARNPRLWRVSFAACLGVAAANLGGATALASIGYGYANWNSVLLATSVLGTSAAALVSLTPRIGVLNCHILPLLLPCIAADFYIGGRQGYIMAAIATVYLGFLAAQGLNLHSDYRKALKAKRQLESAKRAAEAANEAKGMFLANMSHELRTPMNGIIGMTELALDTDLTAEQRELLEIARSSAGSLLCLLNDVLDFSKIEARKLPLEDIPFPVRGLVEDVAKILGVQARRKNLLLAHTVHPNVPPEVRGDPVRLRQVLVNLLSNAIKFTPAGEVSLHVSMEPPGSGEVCLRFTVTDTGIGIAPETQQAIFEPFYQGDGSTTRRYGGTGLGLSIALRLVELMGGRLWLESEPGKGSAFYFTARFHQVPSVPELPATHQQPVSPAATR